MREEQVRRLGGNGQVSEVRHYRGLRLEGLSRRVQVQCEKVARVEFGGGGGRERGPYSRTNRIEGLADLKGLATVLAWQEGTAHRLGETKG